MSLAVEFRGQAIHGSSCPSWLFTRFFFSLFRPSEVERFRSGPLSNMGYRVPKIFVSNFILLWQFWRKLWFKYIWNQTNTIEKCNSATCCARRCPRIVSCILKYYFILTWTACKDLVIGRRRCTHSWLIEISSIVQYIVGSILMLSLVISKNVCDC
jgi:hypothetical protein